MTAESHIQDKVTKLLSLPQAAAIQQIVQTMPMANATNVRRRLELHSDKAAKVSPGKQHSDLVARAVASACARALQPFTQGEQLRGEEGSLIRLSEKIFLQTLVREHNEGGKHLDLHQPVCLGFQYRGGVTYGNYATPMLLLHACRGVNSQWPFRAGFDATFGLSNKQFDLMGITAFSLRGRANPICLCIVNKESAIAYENMYDSMESGVFQLVHQLKLCRKCNLCRAIAEQKNQEPMRLGALITPPKPRKKDGKVVSPPFVFELPLVKPMCDNTTKFSKWICKRKPKLAENILICAAHFTGIAWQKRSHTKYFDNQKNYKIFYKLLVRSFEMF